MAERVTIEEFDENLCRLWNCLVDLTHRDPFGEDASDALYEEANQRFEKALGLFRAALEAK